MPPLCALRYSQPPGKQSELWTWSATAKGLAFMFLIAYKLSVNLGKVPRYVVTGPCY